MCEGVYVTGDISCAVETDSNCLNCANKESTEPCEDCMKHLKVDVADFIWNGLSEPPLDAEDILQPLLFLPLGDHHITDLFLTNPLNTRGPPPPGVNSSDSRSPIFLRNSTLRL